MKKVPEFWWDFKRNMEEIVVESDDGLTIARFLVGNDPNPAIAAAESLIDDVVAGRKDYRALAREIGEAS